MRIGVFCSGGDSPGMNPAIRAVTRCALDRGIDVVGIHEGWQGVSVLVRHSWQQHQTG